MAIVRWNPWGLLDIQRDMDQLVSRMLGSATPLSLATQAGRREWVPAVDVFTRGDDLVVRAELPGIDPEKDMDISLQDGVLTIRGERREERREERDHAYRFESSYGSFERSVMLPEGLKEEDISATYEKGILEVVVPKAGQLRAPKRIPVQVGDSGQTTVEARGEKSD